MKNTTLYRKYRPQTFDDVLGQSQVTSTLLGQIENGKFSHAYLFAGSRGTGKTSMARIFARAIGTEEQDIYEIDAASNRKIENIRELRQSIHALPFSSPHKVYIIDEVHMLTKEAFNALLKSLEEPPEHVVFVLATTELQKIPETILSRCEIHEFKKPNQAILKNHVLSVAEKEGKKMDSAAADLIALLGDGAFRDTLGVLQKVLTATRGEGVITSETVSAITGAPEAESVNRFIVALAEEDLKKALLSVREAGERNKDLKIFLRMTLQKLRAILLLRFAPEMKKSLSEDFTEEEFSFLEKIAADPKAKINSRAISELLLALEQMKDAYLPELPLELALVRLLMQNGEG
ncbi:MAG TPA: DNA polymerase III subunit gamma/tau [Candidatus Paceibacterota bacterium]|nr:DNA polymerase III subunit gamma/tau [Candidatus Paceibacterota bacterium]